MTAWSTGRSAIMWVLWGIRAAHFLGIEHKILSDHNHIKFITNAW
jgi:hypothetical protein